MVVATHPYTKIVGLIDVCYPQITSSQEGRQVDEQEGRRRMNHRSRRVQYMDKNDPMKSGQQQATNKYTNKLPRPFKYASNSENVRRRFIHNVDGKALHNFSERQACPCVAQ
jgi:hypothetical protein